MMEITDVEKLANLAKIAINDEQKANAQKSLNEILNYAEGLKEVNTDGVEPMLFMRAKRDVLREDIVGVELSQEEALQNAPIAKKGHFAIPKVIG